MWRTVSDYCVILIFILQISVYTANSQNADGEKPGICPEFTIPTNDLCVIECNKDSECPSDNKCCSLISCGSICTSPLLPTASTKQAEVKSSSQLESENCQNECDNSRQCGSFSLCIRKGCKRVCKSFNAKKSGPTVKPSVTPIKSHMVPQIPSLSHRNCTDKCLRDAHCEIGFKCVPSGCRNVCERRNIDTNIATTSNIKAEECNDRCARDIHCPFGYECIQQGCRKVCYRTHTSRGQGTKDRKIQLLRSSISTPHHSNDCQQICQKDADCSQGSICIQQGCRTFCLQHRLKLPQSPEQISPSVVGSRRHMIQHGSEDCQNECMVDVDCNVGFYCRRRGCKRICKRGNLESSSTRKKVVPSSIQVQSTDRNCQNECNEDLDCNVGFSCRQNGCKRICKQDNFSRSTNIQKSSDLRCQNQCERDSDCSFGSFCVKNGCKMECIQNFITTTMEPSTCIDECTSSRECNLGFICVRDGCKNSCQKYQTSQAFRQNNQNVNTNTCKNECFRNTDCSTGYNCVQDGCNKICSRNMRKSTEIRKQSTQDERFQTHSESCSDQCSRDTDCNSNSMCTYSGCRRICVSTSVIPIGPASPFLRGGPINEMFTQNTNSQNSNRQNSQDVNSQHMHSGFSSSNIVQKRIFK